MRTNALAGAGASSGAGGGAEGRAACLLKERLFGCESLSDGALDWGRAASVQYVPKTNFVLPESVAVSLRGVPLAPGTDYIWDANTGVLSLPPAAGDVEVTVSASLDGVSYSQRQYIQSSGTQYIDTGVYGSGSTSGEVVFATLNTYPSSWWGVIGACQQDYIKSFLFDVYASGSAKCNVCNGTSVYSDIAYSFTPLTPYKVYINKTKTYINDVLVKTLSSYSYTTPVTMYLFWQNCSVSSSMYRARMRLYSCSIWESSALVRRFVPCVRVSDGAVGLYDEANGVFYGNAGSGVFECG
jgi:hypothetical protein